MRNQTIRLFLYSSLAIVGMTLAWGFKSIPQQRALAEKALHNSLEQELITLSSAVRSSTQALRFKLLDILKAEGNDRPTRAFQDSIFVAASLVEWDQNFWKPLWHSSKTKEGFQSAQFKSWIKDWPLSKLNSGEVYFIKVGEVQGQAHFAVVVPVRKPNGIPMVGIGVFPANQFGLNFSADRTREIQVFDDQGFALSLSRPAYLGSSLKSEPLVEQMIEGGEISSRLEWKNDSGTKMAGVSTRMSDSNLSAALESPLSFGSAWIWQSWLYLLLCAVGAIGLNWYVLNSLVQPLLEQITQSDSIIEQLKRARAEQPASTAHPHARSQAIPQPEMEDYSFIEPVHEAALSAQEPAHISLGKVVHAALRSLDSRLKERNIRVQQTGIEGVQLAGDALQLQTAFEEIIKNSIESMAGSEDRWLTVMAETKDGRVKLIVEDTGVGIPAENLEKVFDPFFSTKDAEGVSRGLGLNVVRRVLEEMSGSVKIQNRDDTSGTRVELEWPLERPAQVNPPLQLEAASEKQPDVFELDELDEDDDFSTLIMQAPLVPTASTKGWPEVAVRKPKVRALD